MAERIHVKRVAEIIGVSASKVYQMVADGQLPGAKIAGRWSFNEAEVRAWLADRVCEANGLQNRRLERLKDIEKKRFRKPRSTRSAQNLLTKWAPEDKPGGKLRFL